MRNNEEKLSKKQKIIQKGLELSNDEISSIILFLDLDNILNLSMTNHEMYDHIFKIAKNKSKEVVYDPWTIKKAFTKQILKIKLPKDLEIFKKKKDIIEGLIINDIRIQMAKEISSKEYLYLMDPEDLEIYHQKFKIHNDKSIKLDVSSLVEAKNLKMIHFDSTTNFDTRDFEIIFKFPKLEEITFSYFSDFNADINPENKKIPTLKKFIFNENFDSFNSFKNFIWSLIDLEHIQLILYEVLEIEHFFTLLNFKNLKSFLIEFSYSFQYDKSNKITDKVLAEVVNQLTNLEEFTMKHCDLIDGSFFSMIKNPKLKKIHIDRNHNGLYVDEIDSYDFQETFYNLKELKLECFENQKIINSIMKYCPNLISLEIKNQSFENIEDFLDYFILNVPKERVEKFHSLNLNGNQKRHILEMYSS